MRLIVIACFVLVLVSAIASAAALADYPGIFLENSSVNAVIVVGRQRTAQEISASNQVIHSLMSGRRLPRTSRYSQYAYRRVYLPPEIVFDNETENIFTTNAIVIGTPCHNSKVRQLLGISEQHCRLAIQHRGYLKLIEHPSGKKQLVITGSDPEFVLQAAKYLVNSGYGPNLLSKAVSIRFAYVSYRPRGFLSIGETLGNEMPSLYSGYPCFSYR